MNLIIQASGLGCDVSVALECLVRLGFPLGALLPPTCAFLQGLRRIAHVALVAITRSLESARAAHCSRAGRVRHRTANSVPCCCIRCSGFVPGLPLRFIPLLALHFLCDTMFLAGGLLAFMASGFRLRVGAGGRCARDFGLCLPSFHSVDGA